MAKLHQPHLHVRHHGHRIQVSVPSILLPGILSLHFMYNCHYSCAFLPAVTSPEASQEDAERQQEAKEKEEAKEEEEEEEENAKEEEEDAKEEEEEEAVAPSVGGYARHKETNGNAEEQVALATSRTKAKVAKAAKAPSTKVVSTSKPTRQRAAKKKEDTQPVDAPVIDAEDKCKSRGGENDSDKSKKRARDEETQENGEAKSTAANKRRKSAPAPVPKPAPAVNENIHPNEGGVSTSGGRRRPVHSRASIGGTTKSPAAKAQPTKVATYGSGTRGKQQKAQQPMLLQPISPTSPSSKKAKMRKSETGTESPTTAAKAVDGDDDGSGRTHQWFLENQHLRRRQVPRNAQERNRSSLKKKRTRTRKNAMMRRSIWAITKTNKASHRMTTFPPSMTRNPLVLLLLPPLLLLLC